MAGESMQYCSSRTRAAKTHLAVLERGMCYGYPATRVLFRPITGRRHQLRVHSTTLGHTIVMLLSISSVIIPYNLMCFRLGTTLIVTERMSYPIACFSMLIS